MPRSTIPLADALALGLPLTELQCAEFLQVGVRTLRRLIAEGLPALKAGGRRRFDIAEVRQWLMTTQPQLEKQSAGLHPKESREQLH